MALAASVNGSVNLPKSASAERPFFMGVTGLTVTATIRKVGGSFGAIAGAITEIASGWYLLTYAAGDTDTEGPVAIFATDGGTNVEHFTDQVAAPVKLADGVAHGGTPGSSKATIALAHLEVASTDNNPTIYIHGSGIAAGIQCNGGDGGGAGAVFYGFNGSGMELYGDNQNAGLRGNSGLLINGSGNYASICVQNVTTGGGQAPVVPAIIIDETGAEDVNTINTSAITLTHGTGGDPISYTVDTLTKHQNEMLLESILAGKSDGMTAVGLPATVHNRNVADTKNRRTATQDANKNTTATPTLDFS